MPAARNPELAARRLVTSVGIEKPPVNLERIAKRLGIEVMNDDLGDELSGVLIKEGGKLVIVVNGDHHENRRRFTLAHEIGHHVLGHSGEMFVDKTLRQKAVIVRRDGRSSEGTDADEIQANRFAAELLMPKQMIETEVSKRLSGRTPPTPEVLVGDLAAQFRVSRQAMGIRLVNLGFLIPQEEN